MPANRWEHPEHLRYGDWWPATVGDLRAALAVLPKDLHVARAPSGDIVLLRQPEGEPGNYSYAGRVSIRWGVAYLEAADPDTDSHPDFQP